MLVTIVATARDMKQMLPIVPYNAIESIRPSKTEDFFQNVNHDHIFCSYPTVSFFSLCSDHLANMDRLIQPA